jgi:hypothetical protein
MDRAKGRLISRFTSTWIYDISLPMGMMTSSKAETRTTWSQAAVLILAFIGGAVHAAPVQFTIDKTQSTISLAGSVLGNDLKEQGPGSLATTFSGVINADVSDAGIQFTGGSTITGLTNGVWQPGSGGGSGSAPADYAAQATTIIGPLKGALRNLVLDVRSGVLGITNNQFDASALVFAFPTNSTATFDYDAGLLGHSGLILSGLSTNKVVNGATLIGAAGARTLTIQTDTQFQFTTVSGSIRLTGNLVAKETTQGASPRITSIQVQGQTVTLHVQGVTSNAAIQLSTNLVSWSAQPATRTDENNGAVFSFSTSGPHAAYQVKQ